MNKNRQEGIAMESNISSVSTQRTEPLASIMKNTSQPQPPQPEVQKPESVNPSMQSSGLNAITYSSKGTVETVSVQAVSNAGFETIV